MYLLADAGAETEPLYREAVAIGAPLQRNGKLTPPRSALIDLMRERLAKVSKASP